MHRKKFISLLILRLAAAAVCLALLLFPAIAQAHANLLSSDPPNGAVLEQAPKSATLKFTEPLDPTFSKAELVDSNLQVVAPGPGAIDPGDNHVLHLSLPSVSPGAYSIVWQARSAADGHLTNGIVSFSVGTGVSPAALLPPPGTPDPTSRGPYPLDTLLRWTSYLAAALAAGSLFFGLLVWRPAYRRWEAPQAASDLRALYILKRLVITGLVSLIGLTVAFILFQAWQTGQGTFKIPFTQALLNLIQPGQAWVTWLRILLLGFLLYLAVKLTPPGQGSTTPWFLALMLALYMLLSFSLESHAAALNQPLPILIDWLHIIAMTAWLGGLLPLFLLLRSTEMPASVLVPRFSRLALVCVAILALSGLYSAYLEVHTVQALISTLYGQALAFKSLLFFTLIGFGAINLLLLSPRLKASTGKAVRWMRYTVRFELALGLLLLAAVGIMAGVTPALSAVEARQRMGYIDSYHENGSSMDLWVAPARVGVNEIGVDVHDLPPNPSDAQPAVLIRLQPLDGKLGTTQVQTTPVNETRYTVRGGFLSLAGSWQVEVIVRQPGVNDFRHAFTVQVQQNPFLATLQNPFPATDASIAAGKALYEQNCLPCHGPQGKGDGPAGLALRPQPADLTAHTVPGVHSDGQLYDWITNGFPGSAMPAFSKLLADEPRWNLVNYIRTFGRKQ